VYYKSVSAIAGGGKTAVLLNTFSKGLARCSGSNWVFFPDPNWLCAPGANIPKFDVVSDLDLRDGLNALGITGVFDATVADFSPMTSKVAEIFLSKADHAARVAIDEEGVTAAAYTVMMMAGAAAPPEEEMDFVLDRPFLFAITGADGLPLFVGVVNRP
jgi:hypothetical protein